MPTARPGQQLDDEVVSAALLGYLLALAPRAISADELRREFLAPVPSFADTDQFNRALRDLERFGLITATPHMVILSRAAQHFDRLAGHQ
jgi:hypothetical protein